MKHWIGLKDMQQSDDEPQPQTPTHQSSSFTFQDALAACRREYQGLPVAIKHTAGIPVQNQSRASSEEFNYQQCGDHTCHKWLFRPARPASCYTVAENLGASLSLSEDASPCTVFSVHCQP